MTISRNSMSRKEREVRSKLAKIVHELGLLRGTLQEIERYCGRTDCKCIKGQKHPMTYVAQMKNGKGKSIYVARHNKEKVIEWIKNYREAKELFELISDECIARLKSKS